MKEVKKPKKPLIFYYGVVLAALLLSFILSWVLPIVLFIGIGQFMSKKLMDRAGATP